MEREIGLPVRYSAAQDPANLLGTTLGPLRMGEFLSVLVGNVTRVATDFAAPIGRRLLAVEVAHTTLVEKMLDGSTYH